MRPCSPRELLENGALAVGGPGARNRGLARADEKRGLKNDLVLAEGDGVSGFHAEVRLSGGKIRVKDLNSTNGTFVANKRVSGEVEVAPGEIFMLSTTPLQAFLEEIPAPPVPSDQEIAGAPAFGKMLAAVFGSARRQRDGFADTRHLLDAIARSKNAAVAKAFGAAGTSAERVLDALWGGGLFSGEHEWLRRFLAAPSEGPPATPAAGREPPLSVRVRSVFGAALTRVSGYPAAQAEPAPAMAPAPRSSAPAGAARASAALPVFTTGDVVLDQRARAIAIELEEAAAVYRFSTSEDRRSVLKQVVKKALASVAPENRTRILDQIRLQFPIADVPPPPPPAAEVVKLQARIRELERQIEEHAGASGSKAGKRASVPGGGIDWRAILAEEPPEGRHADANLQILRELVASARRTERFLLGVIQGVTMPGSETASFKLPAHRYTLGAFLSFLEQGKEPDGKAVADYLRDLERWQVAILAGHHESARLWFEKFWKKVAPSAIEGMAAKAGGWKLGGGAAELWNRYKDAVEGLSPDVVQDQVLKAAYRFAQEEYDRMTK